ncbi:MAG: hypothetical protein QW063_00585 [Candidatus Nanoarchaeia archaeon]
MASKTGTILLAIALIIIIAFSGCISKQKTEQIVKQKAFIGGNEGISIEKMTGLPPDQIYEGQDFQIGVTLKNKGEAEASNIVVSVAGIDATRFQLSPVSEQLIKLSPVSKIGDTMIPGGQAQIIFNAKAPDIVGAQAQYPLQIIAIYDYSTQAVAGVCMKESLIQQTTAGPEICKLTGNKPVESSGAPMKVVSVEELPTGFNIKIKNVGRGYPFVSTTRPSNEGDINPFTQKDRVEISAKLGDTTLTCTQSVLLLTNNEATVFCPATLSAGAEYVEQLAIKLNYGYVERISTTLNILAIS